MEMIVVCYYTPDYYHEAARLALSLLKAGLPSHFEIRQSQGSWIQNVHIRATFLKSMRKLYPDKTLLSLDVDCVVHSNKISRPYLCDIAFHTLVRNHRGEKLPGTLFLNPTSNTDKFLDEWIKQNELSPNRSDRVNFAIAINKSDLTTLELDPRLCWIFDISKEAYGDKTPIIEHLQASRSFKYPKGSKDISRIKRIKEIENEFRRLG